MSVKPYVGVSGITTREQAQTCLDMWPKSAPPQSLMLGVLTSQKVQHGGERNPRSPAPEDIHRIWPSDPRSLNLVHYFTKDVSTLSEGLMQAVAHPCDFCDGAQINVTWPPPEQIEEFLQLAPRFIRVVLQVGPDALHGKNHAWLTGTIGVYAHNALITDVLIDMSGGRGVSLDLWTIQSIAIYLRQAFPDLGIGIAGGLCAETLPSIAALVVEHGLSIDAEGRLRNDTDELDLDKVRTYLGAAAAMWGWT